MSSFVKNSKKPRVTKYFLVHSNLPRYVYGASYGNIAGFSFNVIDGITSNYDSHIEFLQQKIRQGYYIIDSGSNELYEDELVRFIDSCLNRKCFFARFKDVKGYSFTEIKLSREGA